jgi:hypothetical protein
MKFVLESIDALPDSTKSEYELRDGKFYLKLEGDHPALVEANGKITAAAAKIASLDTKVDEFRTNNINLLKELEVLRPLQEKFKDLDPDAARAALAKVEALGKKGIKNEEDVDARVKSLLEAQLQPFQTAMKGLQDQLATSAAAAAADRKRADDLLLKSEISEKFIKAGGKAKATSFIVGEAKSAFEVKDGHVVAKVGMFNPEKPGEPLTTDDWLVQTLKVHDYTIEPSKGGGAPANRGAGDTPIGLKPGQTLLKNPTPQQLGQFAGDIAAGKVKIEFENVTT